MISFLKSSNLTDKQLSCVLHAHIQCPELVLDPLLRAVFLKSADDNVLLNSEGIRFLAWFVDAYAAYPEAKYYYLDGAGTGALSFKDALALPKEHPELCSSDHIDLLRSLPA